MTCGAAAPYLRHEQIPHDPRPRRRAARRGGDRRRRAASPGPERHAVTRHRHHRDRQRHRERDTRPGVLRLRRHDERSYRRSGSEPQHLPGPSHHLRAEKAGVHAADIQTTQVSLWPQTSSDGSRVTGYQASNSVQVTGRDRQVGSARRRRCRRGCEQRRRAEPRHGRQVIPLQPGAEAGPRRGEGEGSGHRRRRRSHARLHREGGGGRQRAYSDAAVRGGERSERAVFRSRPEPSRSRPR